MTSIAHGFKILLAIAVAAVAASAGAAAQTGCAVRCDTTIHVTGWGIAFWGDGKWRDVSVGDMSGPRLIDLSLYDADATGLGRIAVPMPSDEDLRTKSVEELRGLYADAIRRSMDAYRAQGVNEFEFQIIQNTNILGYFDNIAFRPYDSIPGFAPLRKWLGVTSRQEKVAQFGEIAYGAVGDVVRGLQQEQSYVAVDMHLGSNDVAMAARAAAEIASWGGAFKSFVSVNGRAFVHEMRNLMTAVGEEKFEIITSEHDAYAHPWSVAWRGALSPQDYPGVKVRHLEPVGESWLRRHAPWVQHLSSMHEGPKFTVSDDGAATSSGILTRDELFPRLTAADYRSREVSRTAARTRQERYVETCAGGRCDRTEDSPAPPPDSPEHSGLPPPKPPPPPSVAAAGAPGGVVIDPKVTVAGPQLPSDFTDAFLKGRPSDTAGAWSPESKDDDQ